MSPETLLQRIKELEESVQAACPDCLIDDKHKIKDSPEQIYYRRGYLSALKDVLADNPQHYS